MHRQEIPTNINFSLAAITTSCGLENCDEPFKTPNFLNIRPKIVCRVSYFDDILGRSVSCTSSLEDIEITCFEKSPQIGEKQIEQIKRKPLRDSVRRLSLNQACPSPVPIGSVDSNRGLWHASRPVLVKEADFSSTSSLSSDSDDSTSTYTVLTQPGSMSMDSLRLRGLGHCEVNRDSSAALSETSQKPTHLSIPKKEVATPSSSIGSSSRRSPLSNMRYIFLQTMGLKIGLIGCFYRRIDNPEITIQPVVRFLPLPRTPSAQGPIFESYFHCNNGPVPTPTTADIRSVQRQPSAMVRPLALGKQTMVPRAFREECLRKSCRVPLKASFYPKPQLTESYGAYNRYKGVGRHEDSLEAHTRAIEEAILAAHKLQAQDPQHATVKVGSPGELAFVLHMVQFIEGELRNCRIKRRCFTLHQSSSHVQDRVRGSLLPLLIRSMVKRPAKGAKESMTRNFRESKI